MLKWTLEIKWVGELIARWHDGDQHSHPQKSWRFCPVVEWCQKLACTKYFPVNLKNKRTSKWQLLTCPILSQKQHRFSSASPCNPEHTGLHQAASSVPSWVLFSSVVPRDHLFQNFVGENPNENSWRYKESSTNHRPPS